MTRLVFAEPAERDLQNIIGYIDLENPVAPERVYRAITTTAERLTSFPWMGRPGRLPGVRELSIPSLPYLIVYEVGADAVTVVAVFHTSRDLAPVLWERRAGLNEA